MSFRIGSGNKTSHAPLPKNKGGITLGGFSFKQLEEDEEEEEDLSICTGKYDKVQRSRLSTHSTSSNSSTSSASGDVKPVDSKAVSKDTSSKMSKPSEVVESTSSPLRNVKEKLESSRELFAGLKGKTLHEISKAIDAFSGESNSPSPENEKPKLIPVQVEKSIDSAPIVAESASLLHSNFTPVSDHPLAVNDDVDVEDEDDTESTEVFKDPEEDALSVNSGESVDDVDTLVFQDIYTNEPYEDFTGTQGLSTSTRLKPKSKLKRIMEKKNKKKTTACASLSGLASLPNQSLDLISDHSQNLKNEDTKVLSSKPKTCRQSSESKTFALISKTDYSELPLHKFAAIGVVVFAYLIIPLPSYLSGFVMGCILSSFGGLVYLWLSKPASPPEPIFLPPIEDLPPPPVPEMKDAKDSDETLYKGWMNELTDYKVDDYHINKTHSIFLSLEGTHLRLQRPKNPAPKRAMWNENITKPQFIHQRHFDMRGASVYLFPFGLVKKRVWSKKYPICVDFPASESKEPPHVMRHTSSEPSLGVKDKDKASDLGFEIVGGEKCCNSLFLFARTARDKEDWFKRLSAAANGKPLGNHILEIKRSMKENHVTKAQSDLSTKKQTSTDSLSSISSQPDCQSQQISTTITHLEGADLQSFALYMGRLMPAGGSTPSSKSPSPVHASSKLPGSQEKDEIPKQIHPNGPVICDNQLFWLNALIGRCFFDFLRDKWWIEKVTEKLQRKLSKIRVPYFIEELQVTSIDMGYEIPTIRHAGKPYLDERGFWVDLDLTYSGGFKMTIETKINLMKLKKSPHTSNSHGHSVDGGSKSAITDSDEEDSAESSTDEDEEVPANTDDSTASGGGGGTSKKFLRYLDKITQSRYFQQATEYKVIRRAMENVSNTPLTLTVTVNSLIGKMAINIPPPPSDRLWYGFRVNPHLRLSAKPQVGERAVTIAHVTEWIERKLGVEFQRVFVMPNMDDLVIPILVPGTQVKEQQASAPVQSEEDN